MSVVIVTHNSRDFVGRCIESVSHSDYKDLEIVVVDNDSKDGTGDFIAAEYPGIYLVRNKENLRFARGVNIALAKARGELIFLLNPDAWIEGRCITELVRVICSCPDAGVVGGKVYRFDGTVEQGEGGKFRDFPLHRFLRPGNCSSSPKVGPVRDVDWVDGAAFMFTRKVIDSVGRLDPIYYFYSEEIDFCWRAKKSGFRVLYVPRAIVHHFRGHSANQSPIERFHEVSRVTFALKNYPLSLLFLWAAQEVMGFTKLLAESLFHPRPEEKLRVVKLLRAYVYNFRISPLILSRRVAASIKSSR